MWKNKNKIQKEKEPLNKKTRLFRWIAIVLILLITVGIIGLIGQNNNLVGKTQNDQQISLNLDKLRQKETRIPDGYDQYRPEDFENGRLVDTIKGSTGLLPSWTSDPSSKYNQGSFLFNQLNNQTYAYQNTNQVLEIAYNPSVLPKWERILFTGFQVVIKTPKKDKFSKFLNESLGYYQNDNFKEDNYEISSDRYFYDEWKEGWRLKDFTRIDLINGYRNEWSPNPSGSGNGINRFGSPDNSGILSIPWEDFYNGQFRIGPAGITDKWNSFDLDNSNVKIKDQWTKSPMWTKTLVDTKKIPQVSTINNAYQNKLNELKNKFQGLNLVNNLTSLKLWMPYFLDPFGHRKNYVVRNVNIGITDYEIQFRVQDDDTNSIVSTLTNAMNSKFPNQINLVVDDGANINNGGFTYNNPNTLAPNGISTKTRFEQQLNDIWDQIKKENAQLINKPHINAHFYVDKTANDKFDLYLTINPKGNRKSVAKLIKQNIPVSYTNSELYEKWVNNVSMSKRVKVLQGKTVKWNQDQFSYSDDEAYEKEAPDPSKNYGGAYVFHSNLTITFETLLAENEILFINNKPVDVEDRFFKLRLIDEIVSDPNNGNNKERKNEYEIKLVSYNQDNGINTTVKSEFSFKIIIESMVSDFKISYFAWNPDFNPDQKDLITEFILDPITGKPILDENGKEIPNPKYDPLIDPETGVKKQLIWVNKKSADFTKLKFIPDPKDQYGNNIFDSKGIIDQNKVNGFIAEAFVIPKGIQISDPDSQFGGTGTKLNQGQVDIGQKEIKTWKEATYGNDTTYLSKSGIYLFTDDVNNSMSTVKMVGYGVDAKEPQLFTDIFMDPSEFGWTDLWSTYQGKHLKEFLKEIIKLEDPQIDKLKYPEIISYWKEYVTWVVTNELGSDEIIIIKPTLNEDKIKAYAKSVNRHEFNPDEKELANWLGEFDHKDKVNFEATVLNKNTIQVNFSLGIVAFGKFKIDPPNLKVNVKFKDTIDDCDKTKLELDIDNSYIESTIKTINEMDFNGETGLKITDIFEPDKVFRKNADKITFNAILINNKSKIEFNFFPKEPDKYCLDPIDQSRVFDNNLLDASKYLDMFFSFKEKEFNLKGFKITIDEIKSAITKFAISKVSGKFVFGQDWTIKFPSDQELEKLTNMSSETDIQAPFVWVKLHRLETAQPNYQGEKLLQVWNKGNLDKNITDLSQLKLKSLTYKLNYANELESSIIKDVNTQLAEFNLELGLSVEIKDLSSIAESFFIKKGTKTINLKIEPIYNYLNNFATISVTNTTEQAIHFDLSKIYFPDLDIQLTSKESINKAIQEHLKTYLWSKYGFTKEEINVYHLIDSNKIDLDDHNFLRSLVAKNPPEWTISKLIKIDSSGKTENVYGEKEFNIINHSGEENYDPDQDGGWIPPNKNQSTTQNNTGVVLGGVFGSLGLITIFVLAIFGSKFYFNNSSKKIK